MRRVNDTRKPRQRTRFRNPIGSFGEVFWELDKVSTVTDEKPYKTRPSRGAGLGIVALAARRDRLGQNEIG
jgi:hypothetical protein